MVAVRMLKHAGVAYHSRCVSMGCKPPLGADETTDYIGGIQYKNEIIDFIQHAEGRALKNGSVFNYEYQLKDHLGNVRVSVDAGGSVIQRDDYYPFGLTFNSYVPVAQLKYKT